MSAKSAVEGAGELVWGFKKGNNLGLLWNCPELVHFHSAHGMCHPSFEMYIPSSAVIWLLFLVGGDEGEETIKEVIRTLMWGPFIITSLFYRVQSKKVLMTTNMRIVTM